MRLYQGDECINMYTDHPQAKICHGLLHSLYAPRVPQCYLKDVTGVCNSNNDSDNKDITRLVIHFIYAAPVPV